MHIGKATLSIRVLALTKAILLGLSLAVLAIVAMFGVGESLVLVLSSLFVGYSASIGGALIGASWGFVVGGVLGGVFAWFYNKML